MEYRAECGVCGSAWLNPYDPGVSVICPDCKGKGLVGVLTFEKKSLLYSDLAGECHEAIARAESAEKELYALKEELAEVSQKWLSKEAECNELLLIKAQRDEQREFIEKIGDAVFKSAEVGNAKMEAIEKELAETKAQASRLRNVLEMQFEAIDEWFFTGLTNEITCSECSQSSFSDCDSIVHSDECNSGMIHSVLAETPAKSLARIQAQAIRKAVLSLGMKKRYTANEVVSIMRDKADRLEQEADGR